MGLAEKRAIAKIKTEALPRFQAEIDGIAGTHIELTVDWDSYAEQELRVIEEHVPERGLAEIVKAIGFICRDDLGKEALRESLQKVELRCPPRSQSNELKFEDKVLTVLLGDPSVTGCWPGDRIATFVEEKL
jgi:hypothetical protein